MPRPEHPPGGSVGYVLAAGFLDQGPLPFDPEAFPLPPFGGGQSPSAFRRSLSFFEGRR